MNETFINPLLDKDSVSLDEYLSVYGNKILQESEKLFVRDFLFPIFGEKNIKYVIPQYSFIDSEGKSRRIVNYLRDNLFTKIKFVY